MILECILTCFRSTSSSCSMQYRNADHRPGSCACHYQSQLFLPKHDFPIQLVSLPPFFLRKHDPVLFLSRKSPFTFHKVIPNPGYFSPFPSLSFPSISQPASDRKHRMRRNAPRSPTAQDSRRCHCPDNAGCSQASRSDLSTT